MPGYRKFTEEDFRDTVADNYKSAGENSADIERQVVEEVTRGSISKVGLKEAEEEYAGRLAIAALGGVLKEQGSSVVRIVHNGSYSVDVNHRIKVKDRMRFSTVDDASGILMHLEDQVNEEKIRGTFGIAFAAYWWQRLAAGIVRLWHALSGDELGILHLLFADDGWMVATGDFFWRKLLYWLFVLGLLEVLLSWKKVRGGVQVQWIGYQIDLQHFMKGISDMKVSMGEGVDRQPSALRRCDGKGSPVNTAEVRLRRRSAAPCPALLGAAFRLVSGVGSWNLCKFPEAIRILMDVKSQISLESLCKPESGRQVQGGIQGGCKS